jgi:aminoglycoside phosphotransferase family enzyme/predicted kinase
MTQTQTDQAAAIAFLRTNATSGPSIADDVIQTHGALVFLHKTEALKIKRAVKYDYLDFSTLGQRQKMLQREVDLNSETAPGLYHDVVPLTREANGTLVLGGSGTVLEWVLPMTRFPVEAELSSLADRGLFDDRLANSLGHSIADYHRKTEQRSQDSRVLILEIIEELGREMDSMHSQLGAALIRDFLAASSAELTRIDLLLGQRSQAGWVRRCHGDLHLRNLVMWHDVPTPFDALEFDERLGTCDVLYDLAFLLMDLSHHDLDAAANLVLNSYLLYSATDDHYTGLSTLPLYLAVRAGSRAIVNVQPAAVHNNPPELIADARSFLHQALSFLKPSAPHLIAIGGLSGSGKTTVAREIAPLIGAFPGAVHLRSDLERKAYFGVPPYKKLPASAYQPQISDKIYQIMRSKAQLALAAGQAVILDAVHATPEERELVQAIATDAGCAFTGIWLDADAALRVARVDQRRQDASDADAQVAMDQENLNMGDMTWLKYEAGQALSDLVAQICASLPQGYGQRR